MLGDMKRRCRLGLLALRSRARSWKSVALYVDMLRDFER